MLTFDEPWQRLTESNAGHGEPIMQNVDELKPRVDETTEKLRAFQES